MFDWITVIISTVSGFVIAKIWSMRHKCPNRNKIEELEEHSGLLQFQLHYEIEKNNVRDNLFNLEKIRHEVKEKLLKLELIKKGVYFDDHI